MATVGNATTSGLEAPLTREQRIAYQDTKVPMTHRQACEHIAAQRRLARQSAPAIHRVQQASAFEAPACGYYDSAADGIASNFGTLGPAVAETANTPELLAKAKREADRELRDFLFSVLFSRWTRAAAVLLIVAEALALGGCGGGDDQEEPAVFGPAIPESEYVRCDNGRTAYSIEECRTMPALPKAVQP